MKYVEPVTLTGQKTKPRYVVWEETDNPRKTYLTGYIPETYHGTSDSPYLTKLFELSYSDGTYLPEGYIPLYERFPTNSKTHSYKEVEDTLDYQETTRLIFKSTFDRFGIKYLDEHDNDIFYNLESIHIPGLAHKDLVPQKLDSIYYFTIIIQQGLHQTISFAGLRTILHASEHKPYPKDSQGYLDLDNLADFIEAYNVSRWQPYRNSISPERWLEFYELYLKYGGKGLEALSEQVALEDIKRIVKVSELFDVSNVKELIELYVSSPREWLETFAPIRNEPAF